MSDSIERVTLENAAEQLKTKIRTAFVELLPEDQWKAMVAEELKRFTQETREQTYAGGPYRTVPSAFSVICHEVFSAHIKSEIKGMLSSPEWQQQFGASGRAQASEAVKEWLTANSKQLIESTVQALAQGAAQQLINGMRFGS